LVDANPGNRLVLVEVPLDLRDLLLGAGRATLLHVLVTAHADGDRGHRRVPAALRGAVTVEARDAEVAAALTFLRRDRARVDLVVERDRLLGARRLFRRVLIDPRGAGGENDRADGGYTEPNGGPLPRSHRRAGWLLARHLRVKAVRLKSARCSKLLRR